METASIIPVQQNGNDNQHNHQQASASTASSSPSPTASSSFSTPARPARTSSVTSDTPSQLIPVLLHPVPPLSSSPSSSICCFDIETTFPSPNVPSELIEFGCVLVDRVGWYETGCYGSLVKPMNSRVDKRSLECNGITTEMLSTAPTFSTVAPIIYQHMHERLWCGHNIRVFDIPRIYEAFDNVKHARPVCAGVIDTLTLVRSVFRDRAGSNGMAALTRYFGLGEEKHRAISDCRQTIEVIRNVALSLFMEQQLPDLFPIPVIPVKENKKKKEQEANPQEEEVKEAVTTTAPNGNDVVTSITTPSTTTDKTGPGRPRKTPVTSSNNIAAPTASVTSSTSSVSVATGDSVLTITEKIETLSIDAGVGNNENHKVASTTSITAPIISPDNKGKAAEQKKQATGKQSPAHKSPSSSSPFSPLSSSNGFSVHTHRNTENDNKGSLHEMSEPNQQQPEEKLQDHVHSEEGMDHKGREDDEGEWKVQQNRRKHGQKARQSYSNTDNPVHNHSHNNPPAALNTSFSSTYPSSSSASPNSRLSHPLRSPTSSVLVSVLDAAIMERFPVILVYAPGNNEDAYRGRNVTHEVLRVEQWITRPMSFSCLLPHMERYAYKIQEGSEGYSMTCLTSRVVQIRRRKDSDTETDIVLFESPIHTNNNNSNHNNYNNSNNNHTYSHTQQQAPFTSPSNTNGRQFV